MEVKTLYSSRIFLLIISMALVVLIGLSIYYYISIKTAFFDDTFIYLHTAKNAVESKTFQYFPLAERNALLASSPLKLLLLTLASATSQLFGFTERSLDTARVTLAINGVLTYAVFSLFWLKQLRPYLLLGVLYFFMAGCFDTMFEFEGGLLFLWLVTLLRMLNEENVSVRHLPILLPLGVFIRPDLAVVIYPATLIVLGRNGLLGREKVRTYLIYAAAIILLWGMIALGTGVYPIPVTYWAKAAIPHMVEEKYFIEVFLERIGVVVASTYHLSPATNTLLGYCLVGGLALLLIAGRTIKILETTLVLFGSLFLFSRLPANFWWYYQNVVVMVVAFLVYMLFVKTKTMQVERFISGITMAGVFVLMTGRFLVNPELPWDFVKHNRADGYVYLARHANGDGTYTLPSLGKILIKNPEIGITSFFSGKGAWIWDSAGLAQPLVPRSLESPLKYFYPKRLWEGAEEEAKQVVKHQRIKVYDVWAMEDRNFDAARKKCSIVIEEGALCINEYTELNGE